MARAPPLGRDERAPCVRAGDIGMMMIIIIAILVLLHLIAIVLVTIRDI